jgi:hypothetical protein
LEYQADGAKVASDVFASKHQEIIDSERWIIDGLGPQWSFAMRLELADTLVYIDLPYAVHYWWVVKRLLVSPFKSPEGWPEGSNVLKGTIASIKTLKLCPAFWNQNFVDRLYAKYPEKNIVTINSVSELNAPID